MKNRCSSGRRFIHSLVGGKTGCKLALLCRVLLSSF